MLSVAQMLDQAVQYHQGRSSIRPPSPLGGEGRKRVKSPDNLEVNNLP